MTKIIVPFCPKSPAEITETDVKLYQEADMIEWRADFLPTEQILPAASEVFAKFKDIPLLFTLRTVAEGGFFLDDLETYSQINEEILKNYSPAYLDLEAISKPEIFDDFVDYSGQLLLSYHNFVRVPENLPEIMADLAERQPAIVKIAVQPQTKTELWQLLQLKEIFQESYQVDLIVIAMGKIGQISRILPAPYTFATLSEDQAIAGQLTLQETKQILNILEKQDNGN